jgi:2-amino-4-deoxychorismate synthase
VTDSFRALLSRLGSRPGQGFALIHRPAIAPDRVDLVAGPVHRAETLSEIRLTKGASRRGAHHEALAIVPFRQVRERGFRCNDDGAPLLVLDTADQAVGQVADVLSGLADLAGQPSEPAKGGFDLSDAEFADLVRQIQHEDIASGAGANFVVRRSWTGVLPGWSVTTALAVYRRLLAASAGTHWTFLAHTPERTFLGASPERHVVLRNGLASMNPISGTYRYPSAGASLEGMLRFLSDTKEADELYMVVDEELKMMGQICPAGGQVLGPFLREMSHLAHTEYLIEGETERDPLDVLRATLFAPTVVGSPLRSACDVVARREQTGRSYYAGAIALIGWDAGGRREMDSAILIRTAEIEPTGRLTLGVGATLVRDSDPGEEAEETTAKAAGLLAVLQGQSRPRENRNAGALSHAQPIRAVLSARAQELSRFWCHPRPTRRADPRAGRPTALVIDAEDSFTAMIATLLEYAGLAVTVRGFAEPGLPQADLVVLGPGPGDPTRRDQPKIGRLHRLTEDLLRRGTPLLGICLGHQILCAALGLRVTRAPRPYQGEQRLVRVFDREEKVYFYNSFTAVAPTDRRQCRTRPGWLRMWRDETTGEVHALDGPRLRSVQFHPESARTVDGDRIVRTLIQGLVGEPSVANPPVERTGAQAQ